MTVPTCDLVLDPYDYDFHEDPYPYYQRLRDEAPLYRNDELGFWALSRHADVLAGFRNSTTLSNKYGVSLDPASRGPHASMYRSRLWTMRMFAGFGTAEDTNARFKEILRSGGYSKVKLVALEGPPAAPADSANP